MTYETDEPTFLEYVLSSFPANEFRWTRTPTLTLYQALFLSYGLEPPDQHKNPFLLIHFERFLKEVDVFSIYELSSSAVHAGVLQLYDRQHVEAKNFVKWALQSNIPIKIEFFFHSVTGNKDGEDNGGASMGRRSKPESLRKQIFRSAAELFWRKEEKELQNPNSKLKEYSSPSDLARSKGMVELVKLVNQIGGLSPIQGSGYSESGVDLEWFSDLYPGNSKPGPKSKPKKK